MSLWQRIFNVIMVLIVLYFFWLTSNYRAVMQAKTQLDELQTEVIAEMWKSIENLKDTGPAIYSDDRIDVINWHEKRN